MSIEVANESAATIELTEFSALARFVLDELYVHPQAELFIRFVTEEEIADLHEQWLDLPGPTDVMSFPMDEIRPGKDTDHLSEGILGDVVICPTVAARQAATAGHSAEEEMLLLATHGILHLLGFDHAEPEDEKVMFALQRKLLLTFLAGR